jgi:hypothetical protein
MRKPLACAAGVMVFVLGITIGCALAQSTVVNMPVINTGVPPVTYTLQGVYWPTSAELTTSLPGAGNLASWNTPFIGIDFRVDTQWHWGIHLNGMTGSQGSWTFLGTSSPGLSLSGTDTIWSADVSYAFTEPEPDNPFLTSTLRVFAGYGSADSSLTIGNLRPVAQMLDINSSSAAISMDSTGVRVGVDFSYPFESGWSLNAGVAYSPWITTTGTALITDLGTRSISVAGTAWDWSASMQYNAPGHWNIAIGYRFVKDNQGMLSVSGTSVCPCQTQWQGPFAALGVDF